MTSGAAGTDAGSSIRCGAGGGDVHPETPKVLTWLREHRSEIVRLVEELVERESPTTEPESQGPVFDRLARGLREAGYRSRRLPGSRTGGQLLARPAARRRGRPLQMVIGHVDTVWPRGTLEAMPIRRRDDRLYGPGVYDMKGGLAQIVFALRALDALGLEPEVTPVVFVNSDEEIGSPESERWMRRLARRSVRALVLEPALGTEGRLKTARRGVGQFRVLVRGRSSHTGLAPEQGASAIQELSHVIQALHGISDPERGITVNVGQIHGGTRPNVVAAEATAVVDVRVRTREDGRWIEERMRELEAAGPSTPGTTVEIRGGVERAPMERTPRNQALWHAARAVGRRIGLDLEQGTSGGASDGNITTDHTATIDGLGPVGDGAHAEHEHLVIDSLPERAALLAGILLLPRRSVREPEASASESPTDAASGDARGGSPADPGSPAEG